MAVALMPQVEALLRRPGGGALRSLAWVYFPKSPGAAAGGGIRRFPAIFRRNQGFEPLTSTGHSRTWSETVVHFASTATDGSGRVEEGGQGESHLPHFRRQAFRIVERGGGVQFRGVGERPVKRAFPADLHRSRFYTTSWDSSLSGGEAPLTIPCP